MSATGGMMRKRIELTISIDTEEDNWLPSASRVTCQNIRQLRKLAGLFTELGVRATYFTTYQVAEDGCSSAILREIHDAGDCEVGAHLHPWNTPPLSGLEPRVQMLMRYPGRVQAGKLAALLESIWNVTDVRPTAFRAGRFGVGPQTIRALANAGVFVDSSVTPLLSWLDSEGPSFLRAPLGVYRLSDADVNLASSFGRVVEVPITVGFTRGHPSVWPRLAEFFSSPIVRRLRIGGMLSVPGLLRRVTLSPETNTVEEMLAISTLMIAAGCTHLHMFLHSGTLTPGLTPFTRTVAEVDTVYGRIRQYVEDLSALTDVSFCTVSEAALAHAPDISAPHADVAVGTARSGTDG